MKNFLKSTAIFACIALMFCACSEDTTEDLSIPQVAPSTISAIVAGDGRAILKWDVPDDENITQCYVRFTNDIAATDDEDGKAGNVDEIRYIDVIPGYPAQYEFTDLPAAKYHATIHNLGENRTLVDAAGVEGEQYVYTIDSYEKRPTVLRVISTNNGVTVTWSGIPDDCRGVYVSYIDNRDEKKTSGLLRNVSVGSTTPTTYFADMQSGTTFNFVTAFKPEAGMDTVYLAASSTSSSVQDAVAKDPSDVKAASGYKYTPTNSPGTPSVELDKQYLQVKWTVPSNDSIVYSVVTYSLLDEATGKAISTDKIKFGGAAEKDINEEAGVYAYGEVSGYGETDILKESNVNIRYIKYHSNGNGGVDVLKPLQAGLYAVSVHNEKAGGLKSNEIAIETASVDVYEHDSFWLPEVLEIVNDKGNISMSWTNIPEDCVKATLTYDNNSSSTTDYVFYDFTTDLLFEGNVMNMLSDITLESVFKPAGFLDEIVHTGVVAVVPQYAPKAPTEIVARPGYDDAGSYLQVKFKLSDSAASDETLANQASVYYTDAEGNVYSERFTSVTTGDFENVVKVYGNIVAGESYTVAVAAENLTGESVSASARTAASYFSNTAVDVKAYGPSSYTLPPVGSVGLTITDEAAGIGTAYLYWAENYADFYSIKVTYGADSVFKSLEDGGYTLATPTELPNAVSGSQYSYTMEFKPAEGLDAISYDSVDEMYLYETPDAPTLVSAYPGDHRIQVKFELTSDAKEFIDKVAIIYSDGKTETIEYVDTFYKNGATNIYNIENLNVGTSYTVNVATVRCESIDVLSTYVSGGAAEVYDLAEFKAACSATPTVKSHSFDPATYALTLSWTGVTVNDHPALSYVEFTYANDATDLTKTVTTDIASISVSTTLLDAMPGNDYSYYAVYKPSFNALDEVKIGPVTGTFDDVLMGLNAFNKMWVEYAHGYNDQDGTDNSTNPMFRKYENNNKGTLYCLNAGSWTPEYDDAGTTAEMIVKATFPGDYIPVDNYKSKTYWQIHRLFDGGTNQRYDTGNASYEWQPNSYYTAETTNGLYNLCTKVDGKGVMTKNGAATIDLSGAATDATMRMAYKLSEVIIYRKPMNSVEAAYETSSNLKVFSLYGTNDPDPASNPKLTAVNADGTPDLTNWILMVDHAECVRPTVAFNDPTSPYYQRYDYLDANGDGMVDALDDWDNVGKNDMFKKGWSFDIPDDVPPVRYVRIIFHENDAAYSAPNVSTFVVNDVQFRHKGYTTKTVPVR